MAGGFPQIPPEVVAALAKENQSPQIIAIVIAFTIIAFICIVLRFAVRIHGNGAGSVGMEDYFITISMIFSVFTSVCLIQGARYGNGKHSANVPFTNITFILQYLFFGILAYHVSLTATKMSILLQYRRIFTLSNTRKPIYIAMGICIAVAITSIVTAIFTCIPVWAYWDLMKRPLANCVNQDAMYHANAGLNIATDLLVAALPIAPLWKLMIPLRQKIAVVALLTLGWFVVVISILRLHYLIKVSEHPEDTTWYSGPVAYWSAMEVNIAIVCASLPALKPLLVHLFPKFGSRLGTKGSVSSHPRTIGTQSGSRMHMHQLKGKASVSSLGDDIHLEHGVLPVKPHSHIDDRSFHEDRLSDDSKGYSGFSRPARLV